MNKIICKKKNGDVLSFNLYLYTVYIASMQSICAP